MDTQKAKLHSAILPGQLDPSLLDLFCGLLKCDSHRFGVIPF